MSKQTFEYTEKHHIIEVDGIEYEIPQRTAKLEKEMIEHDKNASEMTEYEANMSMLSILFGKDKAHQMFPDGENTNLDKLAKCTKFSVALYMAEYNAIRDEEAKTKMQLVKPLIEQMEETGKLLNKAQKGSTKRK